LVKLQTRSERRLVERRDKWERAPDVQRDVRVSIVEGASVTAADDQLISAGEEAHDPVAAGCGFQLKPILGPQLLVSRPGIGFTLKRGSLPEAAKPDR
jgi:hypothetical protein